MEELPDENDIDVETLQAQIDLSLAHTKNLVASWIKPYKTAHPTTSHSTRNDEDIKEILKRPPRLGVGAPIPASTGTLGHETIKLKNKLSGKKRQRDDEGLSQTQTTHSDEEEESRGGAIKKKVKVDPFAGGKGKKKQKNADPVKASSIPLPIRVSEKDPERDDDEARESSVQAGPLPLISKSAAKKKKKKALAAESEKLAPPKAHDGPSKITVFSPSDSSSESDDEPTTNHKPESSTKATPATPSTIPVLNLDGPPQVHDTQQSTKKKRKKKKKKKGQSNGNAVEA
ncbi:hypothetical protein C8Q75DRAFT_862668 [Abortiporus biennis]|nr:hypothetical protein C8Q75DRAFT_862668 [Abortiporus biennis]